MSWETYKGKFIVLEGIDGSGKGTFIDRMVNELEIKQIDYKVIAISNIVREYTGKEDYSPELKSSILRVQEALTDINNAETKNMLVYFYNRLFLAYLDLGRIVSKEIVQPLLDKNILVIGDRWFLSTLAYNGGIKKTFISKLLKYGFSYCNKQDDVLFFIDNKYNKYNEDHQIQAKYIRECCKDIIIPDLTIYLDIEPSLALLRIDNSDRNNKEHFEKEDILIRVRNTYKYMYKSFFKDKSKLIVEFTKSLAYIDTFSLSDFDVYSNICYSIKFSTNDGKVIFKD